MPCVMGPALMMIIWGERKARTLGPNEGGKTDSASDDIDIEAKESETPQSPVQTLTHEESHAEVKAHWMTRLANLFHELDAFGLLLLGFGWTLLLLPFSLQAGAEKGYRNPSLIAMFVVGGLCLIAYCGYEAVFARYPTAPVRLLKNRTFVTAIIIDFIYMVAGYMNLTYLSSYVYVVTDIDTRHWNCRSESSASAL